MPSLEEISTWTIQDIRTEIQKLVPEGHTFAESVKDGWHFAVLQCTAPSSNLSEVLWSDQNPDRKLLLLNAFGWLWLRGQKPKHPAWKAHRGGQPARRHPAPFPKIADPPDLDPKEIRAVYEKGPNKK